MIRIERKITTITKIATATTSTITRICPMIKPKSSILRRPFVCGPCDRFRGYHLDRRPEHRGDHDSVAHIEVDTRLGRREASGPGLAVVELHQPRVLDEPRHDATAQPVQGIDIGLRIRIVAM